MDVRLNAINETQNITHNVLADNTIKTNDISQVKMIESLFITH